MLAARRFLVSGRVQGVGFRFFVHEAALREGVCGWVKNRPDGRVEVLAQGPHEAVQRFEDAVRRGPPSARVDAVEVTEVIDAARRGPVTGFASRGLEERGEMDALKQRIRHVPDFPKPGILFYDVTTLLKDREGFRLAIDAMTEAHTQARDRRRRRHREPRVHLRRRDRRSAEDRIRARAQSSGSCRRKTRRASYALEYGTDSLEIHEDAVRRRTARAHRRRPAGDRRHGGGDGRPGARAWARDVVGVQFLIELVALDGRAQACRASTSRAVLTVLEGDFAPVAQMDRAPPS